jgi:hypothetical protein
MASQVGFFDEITKPRSFEGKVGPESAATLQPAVREQPVEPGVEGDELAESRSQQVRIQQRARRPRLSIVTSGLENCTVSRGKIVLFGQAPGSHWSTG